MTTSVPSAPPQANQTSGKASAPSGTGQIDKAPAPVVSLLDTGKTVLAEVTSKTKSGEVSIKTNDGQSLQIKTPMSLPKGSQIELSATTTGQSTPLKVSIKNLSVTTSKSIPEMPQTAVATAQGGGQVSDVPDVVMAQIAPGRAINAEVSSRPSPGVVTLKFPQGKIDVETTLPLPDGARVRVTMVGETGPPFDLKLQHMEVPSSKPVTTPQPGPTFDDSPDVKIAAPQHLLFSGSGIAEFLPPAVEKQFNSSSIVKAEVIAKPQPDVITVQTSEGKFDIKTPLPLPTGATVNLAPSKPEGPPYQLNIQHVGEKPERQIPAPSTTPTPQTRGTGEAVTIPKAIITQFSSTDIVKAEVIAKPQPNVITVQTSEGKFDIKTPLPLPTGSTVNLALSKSEGQPYELNIQQAQEKPTSPKSAPPLPTPSINSGLVENIPLPIVDILTAGAILTGEVVAKPLPGQISVQTPPARLDIKTTLPLIEGAIINLTLANVEGPPYSLKIQEVIPDDANNVAVPSQPLKDITNSGAGLINNISPPIFTQLATGAPLTVEITAKAQTEQITVQTSEGKFDIKTPQPLPTDTAVKLALNKPIGPPYELTIQTTAPKPSLKSPDQAALLSQTATENTTTGIANSIPPQLAAQMTSGKVVEATIISRTQEQEITVQNDTGRFNIITPVSPPIGSKVTLSMNDEIGPPYKVTVQAQQSAPIKADVATTTPSSNQPQAPAAPNEAPLIGSGQVKTLPKPAIDIFQSGKTLSAEVVAKPQSGQLVVQTPQGQLQIQTPLPLPTGSSLVLTLIGKDGPPYTLNIHAQKPTTSPDTKTAPLASARSEIVQSLTNGATLTATIIKSNTHSVVPANQTTVEQATIATGKQTTENTATQTNANAAQTSTPANSAASVALPPGGSVPIKINAIQLPNGPSLPSLGDNPLGLITGEVISNSNGQLQIQTTTSTLNINVQSPPPVGTLLLLSLEGLPTPPDSSSLTRAPNTEMSQRWEGLRDAMTLLNAGDPAAAAKVMQSMPQVGVKIAPSLLFFLNAFRGGNVDNWFGPQAMQSLSKISKASTDKLGSDFRMTQGRATDSAGNDWRSYNIPMLTDSEIEQLRLFTKDFEDNDDANNDPNKKGKRFVIEVNFTKLGPFQFDGVARKKNIDLMIRTHAALESDMRDDIRLLFNNTIEALGLTGSVGFHVSPKFDITPVKEEITYGGGVTV